MRVAAAVAVAGVVLGLGGLVGAPGVAAAGPVAAEPGVPQVRITMTDGVTAPRVHDRLTYTVTLVDRGTTALAGQIRMAAPPGLTGIGIAGGSLFGRELTWPATIPSGGTLRVSFTATVTGASARLATTACAYLGIGGRPIACASDLDRVVLPAANTGNGLAVAGGIVVALLLIVGAVVAVRRRRAPGLPITLPATRAPDAVAHNEAKV